MSVKNELITIFGGSGFIGRHLVSTLAKRGYRICIACRRPYLANYLYPIGDVGQIQLVQANVRFPESVHRAVRHSTHVINLSGILSETGSQKFDIIHHIGARTIAEAARSVGARLTHLSALGCSENSLSQYSRTKAQGEKAVFETLPDSIIFRPSLVFGAEDQFFNKFANMACLFGILPLIGRGVTKFQPVFVDDISEAIAHSVDRALPIGTIYEIGGSDILSFRECMEIILKIIDRKALFFSIPWKTAKILSRIFSFLPFSPITTDQIALLRSHNIVSQEAIAEHRTLEKINITPSSLSSILPTYLWRYRKTGEFWGRGALGKNLF